MKKDPGANRGPSVSQYRSMGIRELDAVELAGVLGGTNQPRPNPNGDDSQTAQTNTRTGRFWRWFFG